MIVAAANARASNPGGHVAGFVAIITDAINQRADPEDACARCCLAPMTIDIISIEIDADGHPFMTRSHRDFVDVVSSEIDEKARRLPVAVMAWK